RIERRWATADARGEARFAELAPGTVELRLDRGVDREAEVTAGETSAIDWPLPAGDDVEGIVRADTGEPVAGAGVWAGRWPAAAGVALARTDEHGEFRIRGFGPMTALVARAPHHRPSLRVDARRLPLALSGARRADLALRPAGESIEGVVRNSEGQPVSGARV